MMTAPEIRQAFLNFFASKGHTIVPSAPIVVKNDPTLMFTNAGMNQFKDYFLGNKTAPYSRAADTQKCLRVSGKHNDLEEVGVDHYHHTMFEMLGNWSFGDYFKAEAIAWSWELLTEVYGIPKDRLYATVFEGDRAEKIPPSTIALAEWKKLLPAGQIVFGNKKDNFWEMGDTGPCGPCTEIHVDMRPDEERNKVPGYTLVNKDHPEVIEIWNNVFIQYNRKKDGSLEDLPSRHVDTGMGLERLVRVLQGKTSNYDTDIFSGTIGAIESFTGKVYDRSASKEAVAFRVLADHIRAISFCIADGQLPSNTGAGYVIRRILRRAVRYYYSYLNRKEPLLHLLVPVLAKQFGTVFPELFQQVDFVSKVVLEEEQAFLRTIEAGTGLFNVELKNRIQDASEQIKRIALLKESSSSIFYNSELANKTYKLIENLKNAASTQNEFQTAISNLKSLSELFKSNENASEAALKIQDALKLSGETAFKLQDTFGFPIDLTILMTREIGSDVDQIGFEEALKKQKNRSRAATNIEAGDWVVLQENVSNRFVGYKQLTAQTSVVKYRLVKSKGKDQVQIVLAETPFYAESGGQVGDRGALQIGGETIAIVDTKKDNDLIIHFAETLPRQLDGEVMAEVNAELRRQTTLHHSVTHLLQAALRTVLGKHVAQKGSLNNENGLRFDFSHFSKMTADEGMQVEQLVNKKIRENHPVIIKELPKEEALLLGATALFGEKYGDVVRVVIMDENYSIELCGGTHVGYTGELGFFKITGETAVAAGVRRIEALCGEAAEQYIGETEKNLLAIKALFKNPKDLVAAIENQQNDLADLRKKIEGLEARQLVVIRNGLLQKDDIINQINFIGEIVEVSHPDALKKLCFDLKNHLNDFVIVLCANIDGKPFVAIAIADNVVAAKGLDAGAIIKQQVAPLIKGGGGGQKNLATAGGQDVSNLQKVIDTVKAML